MGEMLQSKVDRGARLLAVAGVVLVSFVSVMDDQKHGT